MDSAEGWVLWMKLTLLTVSAVVIPLGVPRQYIPVDPKVSLDSFRMIHYTQSRDVSIESDGGTESGTDRFMVLGHRVQLLGSYNISGIQCPPSPI